MKRIGVLTSGGDCPGMNAALRSVVRFAVHNRKEIIGVFRGYQGLIEGELKRLDRRSVSNIINRGGTILKTARSKEFMTVAGQRKAVRVIKTHKIDGLVVIGGNGSFRGAHLLAAKYAIPTIGIPATIDNDISGSDFAIGSETAVNTALGAIDKIRDTATSLERIFVVEVMGRESGFVALQVGLAGGAEDVVIPEIRYDITKMCNDIKSGYKKGKISWIIIVAEGGAEAKDIAKRITNKTKLETRVVVLGHIQRGGTPTAFDRILALRLGAFAVESLIRGETNKAVGMVTNEIKLIDLPFACKKEKLDTSLYKLIQILT